MTTTTAMPESKNSRSVDHLLPGISDDVVLYKILPKLPWKYFYILSSVSRAWYRAHRSRRIWDSRVLCRSSETFVLAGDSRNTIAFCSMRDNPRHKLPPMAEVVGGQHRVPVLGQCVSMDGKIYVIGGVMGSLISNKVFMFDLVGKGHWEQCASMKQPRFDFGSVVADGKIYVFGGKDVAELGCSGLVLMGPDEMTEVISASEVYDPKEDTWSSIKPMPTCQYGNSVMQVGEELFIYGGGISVKAPVKAYHPFKDEWRVVNPVWNPPPVSYFILPQGNAFTIQAHGKSFVYS